MDAGTGKINGAGAPSLSTALPDKSGYLFKWQDRSIGWGGTKWGLRFVRLERGRLSYYRSHEERSPRYIMTLKDCAVKDDGNKVNKRHVGDANEAGAYFSVFSIYQRRTDSNIDGNDGGAQADREEDIVPLLRFSTQSLAEKTQWIDLIAQACAYCDSEDFRTEIEDANRLEKERKPEKGTLPPLYFDSPQPPRFVNLNELAKKHRRQSSVKDASRSNKISYPPSKPMHRKAAPSYLSEDAGAHNYRGMFNLLIIILVVSNLRLLLDTVSRHGFIFEEIGHVSNYFHAPLADFPFVTGLLVVQVFVILAYFIELMLCRNWVGERFGLSLHFVNCNASLIVVIAIIWYLIDNPIVGALLIVQSTITWLKLISYVHANQDYRKTSCCAGNATAPLVQDLDEHGLNISYPDNVTLTDIYYFWFAPTLTYQIAFPRTPFIRWGKVAVLILHFFVAVTLMTFFAAQVIAPTLDNLLEHLDQLPGKHGLKSYIIGDFLLQLSLTSTYLWLLGFYAFFHCFLNITAELLRFADRVFYKDWWNASEVSAYWRLWNMPVHYFLVRHVYFPSVRSGLSKTGATFMVFLLSAILHEVLISVPCHMIRAWSFLAMMGQLPLIFLTKYIDKKIPGSSIGNFIFWISFCFVGQPMAMLLYTIDYWEMHHQNHQSGLESEIIVESVISKSSNPILGLGRFFLMQQHQSELESEIFVESVISKGSNPILGFGRFFVGSSEF